MELRHLRYFVAVAEDLSFTRAAARLRIAQPALSLQIKALETEIGADLFHRQARGVALTPAGNRLLSRAQAIIEDVDRAVREARRAALGQMGLVRVGFTRSASFNPFVTQSISDFHASFPDIEIDLVEAPTHTLLGLISNARLETAFVGLTSQYLGDFWSLALPPEDMVVVLSVKHPLAALPHVDLAKLSSESFLLYQQPVGTGMHDGIIEACAISGFRPKISPSPPHFTTTLSLVAAGVGISIMPYSMQQIALSGIVYRPISGVVPQAELTLVKAIEGPSAIANTFADFISGRVAALAEESAYQAHREVTPSR